MGQDGTRWDKMGQDGQVPVLRLSFRELGGVSLYYCEGVHYVLFALLSFIR